MDSHELEGVWANILRTLRTDNNFSLFGLLATMNDVEFSDQNIILHMHNETEKNMLKQHLSTLQNIAGTNVNFVLQDNTTVVYDENRDYIARLKELFGDKVEIV